jgi:hypothetical protein
MGGRQPGSAQPVVVMSITGLLSDIADAARSDGRSLPVIRTDIVSAIMLVGAIRREIGPMSNINAPDCVGMYDGVKILGYCDLVDPSELQWREHFGELAEIWK